MRTEPSSKFVHHTWTNVRERKKGKGKSFEWQRRQVISTSSGGSTKPSSKRNDDPHPTSSFQDVFSILQNALTFLWSDVSFSRNPFLHHACLFSAQDPTSHPCEEELLLHRLIVFLSPLSTVVQIHSVTSIFIHSSVKA